MNAQVKEQWITALKSGIYIQGQGVLKEQNKYCCLGVLCDLYKQQYPYNLQIGWLSNKSGSYEAFKTESEKRQGCLPEEVKDWAGLEERDPSIKFRLTKNGYPATLSSLNDSGACFSQIASVIEDQL